MKISITEKEIHLDDIGWPCTVVLSNTPGAVYDLTSGGYPKAIYNLTGAVPATLTVVPKEDSC